MANLGELKTLLESKARQDREQIEALTKNELTRLANDLRDFCKNELNTTKTDIANTTAEIESELSRLTRRRAMRYALPWALNLALLATICGGSWGLMRYYSHTIQSQQERIAEQRQTLAQIEARTWGVDLQQAQDGSGLLVILPGEMKAETGWTVGPREAIKLSKK